jgi:hypothetical protein
VGLKEAYAEKAVSAKLAELRAAGDDAWEAIKTGVESAWSELKQGLDQATSKFK